VNIEIHDAGLEARIQKQLQATGSGSVEEVLLRLLETQEEQDRWLLENRETINAKIRRGRCTATSRTYQEILAFVLSGLRAIYPGANTVLRQLAPTKHVID
jgi:hypothetical protein